MKDAVVLGLLEEGMSAFYKQEKWEIKQVWEEYPWPYLLRNRTTKEFASVRRDEVKR